MKRFVIKTIIIAIVPFVVIGFFDLWLRNQNSLYKVKINGLLQQKDSVEVLVLGNSHANYAVDPACFTDFYAYNLANVNQQIYFDKRLTLKALSKGVPKLKYVLISVDYHSLYTSSQGVRDIWSYYGNGIKYKDKSYLKYELSPFIWGYTPMVSISMLKKRLRNLYENSGQDILDFDVESGVPLTDKVYRGFITFSGTDSILFNKVNYQRRADSFAEPINSERKQVLNDLEEFIRILIKKGIRPILYASPTYSEYNKFLDSATIEKNIKEINYLSRKYNIEYWNYSNNSNFKKSDFFNYDHLNKKGAKRFSTLLSERLDKYDGRMEVIINLSNK
nr:hypothetical protein [uncultured Carboxylicivirga sp.]